MNKKTDKLKVKRPPLKIPKSLAAVADLAYNLRTERLDEQKVVEAIATDEKKLKEHLINSLPKGEASGVAGKVARASIVKEDIPRIDDEKKLRAAIKKNPKKWGALLAEEVPINMAVLKSMFEEGNVPPGVGKFTVVKVSLTKV